MRVAALQLAATWNARTEALASARALLMHAPTDLAVLPEASLTGYVSPEGDFDLSFVAEPFGGPTTLALASLAREAGCFLAAPLIERDADVLYNGHVVFDRAGEVVARYRKRHPWYPETWATPGPDEHPVIEVEGARVTIAICFDLHFVEAEAAGALRAADVLLFPSAWVEEEDSREHTLVRLARANDVAVVNANWAPGVVRIAGQGGSCVVDRSGAVLARAGGDEGRIDAVLSP